MAWLLLHFGYADRYAHLYYRFPDKPALGFPDTDRPNMLDFAYFSFTVGASFAASDVEVRARPVRYTSEAHPNAFTPVSSADSVHRRAACSGSTA